MYFSGSYIAVAVAVPMFVVAVVRTEAMHVYRRGAVGALHL
jgi:hypothetical protein